MTDNLKQIAAHYGKQNQIAKCIEELNELALALLRNDYANIVEEIADVKIMLEQVKYFLGITPGVLEEARKHVNYCPQFRLSKLLELAIALSHDNYSEIVLGVAVVEIMLETLITSKGIEYRALHKIEKHKIARQLKRLEG